MTAENSVALLSSVIKQLSVSDDSKRREREKEKLQLELKAADEKLSELVETNQDHLKKTVQSFGSVITRISASRSRIKALHEKLLLCRTLLYCNRDDLKTHWQEGLECSEKLNLLDKIEKAVAVPEQLERFLSRKHYFHAANLLAEAILNLDKQLANVDALRDLRSSLHARKSLVYEAIVDEISKQIHSDSQKLIKKGITESNVAAFKRTFSYKPSNTKMVKSDQVPVFSMEELQEDLQVDPEENIPLFINLLVRSLVSIDKVPEAVEMVKERIKRDMLMVLRRSTDLVAKRAVDSGEVLTIEELAVKGNSSTLLELLEISFEKFRSVALYHSILLAAFKQTKVSKDLNLYTMEDIWSKIQFAIKDMLHPYLNLQNASAPQQVFSSFGTLDSTVASFFTARKRLPMAVAPKIKPVQLFKFECSSSAEAIHSYMREQDIASGLSEDSYTDFVVWNAPQLLCKPHASNITTIFVPVVNFIKEIDLKTNSTLGSSGVLYHFVTNFVEKVFLDQLLYEVSEKESAATKGHDALRNLCDIKTQKNLLLSRPILKGSLVVYNIMEELVELTKILPTYSREILEIVIKTLSAYFESCHGEYKGLVYREGDGKASRIISVNWVKDDDIKRLLMSLPNWVNLRNPKNFKLDDEEDFETTRRLQDREASLLISNLERSEIEKNQVILDVQDLKSVANLQESLEWLSEKIQIFYKSITRSTSVSVSESFAERKVLPQELDVDNDLSASIKDLAQKFKEMSESCLLLLHLEIRCHCFYFIGKATRESSFVCNVDSIEVDPQIPQLAKDLRDIEDFCSAALSPVKMHYLFDGLGYLIAAIIIASTSYIKKINHNGVKKMCQNIFTIQQELANITTRRDLNLDMARKYFELLNLKPEEVLKTILEQGSFCKEQDYANALELLSRSEVPFDKNLWKIRRNKLSEILQQAEEKQKNFSAI